MNAFEVRKSRVGVAEAPSLSEKVRGAPLFRPSFWAGAFIALGILLRLVDFARHSSLSYDEAMLALNIVQRGYRDLLAPLSFEQVAPLGFLWIERFFVNQFGPGESALRLFPMLASIATLPLLWIAARKLAGDRPACLATALVALSPAFLWHSSEVKQYGTETFVSAALLAIGASWTGRWNGRRLALLTAAGLVAILLSNAAPFVLAGVGGFLTVDSWRRESRSAERIALLAINGLWAISFAVIYFHFLARQLGPMSYMDRFWSPDKFANQAGIWTTCVLILRSLVYPVVAVGGSWCPVAVFIAVTPFLLAGAILAAANARTAAFLLMPCLLPLAPAAFGKWIFAERLMSYSLPCTAIMIGLSVDRLTPRLKLWPPWKWATLGCTLVLLLYPMKSDLYELRYDRQNLRESIRFAMAQYRPGDVLYVYSRALPPWLFYSTDWRAPDQARVSWLMAAEQSIGPNGGNVPPRGHAVEKEGFDLRRSHGSATEVIGVATGMFNDRNGPAKTGPDPGWVENEFERVHRELRNGRVVVIACEMARHGLSDLLVRFRMAGARPVTQYRGEGAEVDVLQMPTSSYPIGNAAALGHPIE